MKVACPKPTEPGLIVWDSEMGDQFFHVFIGEALAQSFEYNSERAAAFRVADEKEFEDQGHPSWVKKMANLTRNYRLIQRLKATYDEWKQNEGSMTPEQLEAWDARRLPEAIA